MIDALGMPDRQIMVLYLEELDAASIADVVGLSAVNVATKIIASKRCWRANSTP